MVNSIVHPGISRRNSTTPLTLSHIGISKSRKKTTKKKDEFYRRTTGAIVDQSHSSLFSIPASKFKLSELVSENAKILREARINELTSIIQVQKPSGLASELSRELEKRRRQLVYDTIVQEYERNTVDPNIKTIFESAITLPIPRGKEWQKRRDRRKKAFEHSIRRGLRRGTLPAIIKDFPVVNHLLAAGDDKTVQFLMNEEQLVLRAKAEQLKNDAEKKGEPFNEVAYIANNAKFFLFSPSSQQVIQARQVIDSQNPSPEALKKALQTPGAVYGYTAATTPLRVFKRMLIFRSYTPYVLLSRVAIDNLALNEPQMLTTVMKHPGVCKKYINPWLIHSIQTSNNGVAVDILSQTNIRLSSETFQECMDEALKNRNIPVLQELLVNHKYHSPKLEEYDAAIRLAEDEDAFHFVKKLKDMRPKFLIDRISIQNLTGKRSPFKLSEFKSEI